MNHLCEVVDSEIKLLKPPLRYKVILGCGNTKTSMNVLQKVKENALYFILYIFYVKGVVDYDHFNFI